MFTARMHRLSNQIQKVPALSYRNTRSEIQLTNRRQFLIYLLPHGNPAKPKALTANEFSVIGSISSGSSGVIPENPTRDLSIAISNVRRYSGT